MIDEQTILDIYNTMIDTGREEELPYTIDNQIIFDKYTGKQICTLDTYVKSMQKKYHCQFETIYFHSGTKTRVYRCLECGTVIFTGDDVRYDKDLSCPICAGYKHKGKYYTKEELANDENKRLEVENYLAWQKDIEMEEARRISRGGLYDWQVFSKKWDLKNYSIHIELIDLERNLGRNFELNKVNRPWFHHHIDLNCNIGKKSDDGIVNHTFSIPLSPCSIYKRCILRETN